MTLPDPVDIIGWAIGIGLLSASLFVAVVVAVWSGLLLIGLFKAIRKKL